MIDISSVGSKITIEIGGREPIVISEFSEEGTPFECPDVDLSTNEKNLNGQMISSRKAAVYTVSVTVIPGSVADVELTRAAQDAAIFHGNTTAISNLIVKSIILATPQINQSVEAITSNNSNIITYKWMNGRMKSAPTGPSTSAEGRLSARTFVFEMEKFSCPSGSGVAV